VLAGDDLSHDCLLCGEPHCHRVAMVQGSGFREATER
jgi:hypothetical protein